MTTLQNDEYNDKNKARSKTRRDGPSAGSAKALAGIFKSPMHNYLEAFTETFLQPKDATKEIRRLCLLGKFKTGIQFRHMAWSVLMGLLPPKADDWMGLVHSRRQRYGTIFNSL